MDCIMKGQNVIIIWDGVDEILVKEVSAEVEGVSGVAPRVRHSREFSADAGDAAQCDAVVVVVGERLDEAVAAAALRCLRAGGALVARAPPNAAAARSLLTLSGFVNVQENRTDVRAEKPKYEVGSRSALARGWRAGPAEGDAAGELVDEDSLLGEEDRARPDPAALRVCGTTGLRKACADCSCGLADSLREQSAAPAPAPSACGSCYLGDAFRCSSCPYLGTPAFEPGDRVLLADLSADI